MYKVLNFCGFCDEFNQSRPNQYSYEGLKVLFDYLNEHCGEYSFDVIGVCCDYTECDVKTALSDCCVESIEELENDTIVLRVDNGNIIYQNY